MNGANSNQCVNCNAEVNGNYCSNCGLKRITSADKTLSHFFNELISSLFFANGKLFVSFKMMLFKPGELTRAYISGNRKKYIAPLQLFFFANLLYFLFPMLSTFNTSLSTQIKHLPYSGMVKEVVANHLKKNSITYEDYREEYEKTSSQNGKLLLVVLVLIQALIFRLLFLRNTQFYFSDFLAAAAYFNAIYILFLLILLPGILLSVNQLYELNFGFLNDLWVSIFFLALVILYLLVFMRNAFQISWQNSFIKSTLLTLSLIPSFIVYRFILFWVTFWMV